MGYYEKKPIKINYKNFYQYLVKMWYYEGKKKVIKIPDQDEIKILLNIQLIPY